MKHFLAQTGVALVLALIGATANHQSAAAAVVTSTSLDWLLLPNSIGPLQGTWGLPADLSAIGCGAENETTCEPTGVFIFNLPLNTTKGYVTLTDGANNDTSDWITYGNNANGNGEVDFYSDPNSPVDLTGFHSDGALCSEDAQGTGLVNGCTGTFHLVLSDLTDITVETASDSEQLFDPFGYGFDTSDQIRFTGVQTVSGVPEPSTWAMLMLGLAGLSLMRWRKAA